MYLHFQAALTSVTNSYCNCSCDNRVSVEAPHCHYLEALSLYLTAVLPAGAMEV